MRLRIHRNRPLRWSLRRQSIEHAWTLPFCAIEWCWEWLAYLLSNWSFLEVLEYLSSFGVLVAVIFYFSESGDRLKQKHYQAWQVINTAQGKGGSGGRIEALQELNADRVPLVGVDLSGAFLQGIHLAHGRLVRSNFSAADVRNSDFISADLADSDLNSGNFRYSNLRNVSLRGSNLENADLFGADLTGADLSGASLAGADLGTTNLANISWKGISSVKATNLYAVKNAPEGFLAWALQRGAVSQNPDR